MPRRKKAVDPDALLQRTLRKVSDMLDDKSIFEPADVLKAADVLSRITARLNPTPSPKDLEKLSAADLDKLEAQARGARA